MLTYCSQKVKTTGFYHPHSYYCSDRCGRNRRTSVSWIFCICTCSNFGFTCLLFCISTLKCGVWIFPSESRSGYWCNLQQREKKIQNELRYSECRDYCTKRISPTGLLSSGSNLRFFIRKCKCKDFRNHDPDQSENDLCLYWTWWKYDWTYETMDGNEDVRRLILNVYF